MNLLQTLANDISSVLGTASRVDAMQAICDLVSKAVKDQDFVQDYLPDRVNGEPPRIVLYEDERLGFCICGHVYADAALGSPHDHGPSWAIYGQADGITEMSEWSVVQQLENGVKKVTLESSYTMEVGDVRFYDIGVVHSPTRKHPVKLLRVEGENLDNIKRSDIEILQDDSLLLTI